MKTEQTILLDYWLANDSTNAAVHYQHHIYISTVTLYIPRENYDTGTEETIEYEEAVQDARENYYWRSIIGTPFQSTNVAYGRTSGDDIESEPESEN
jgi:hypothetical protein